MARRERSGLTDEERAERRKQERELTERAVTQVRCGAGWQRWLTVCARVGLPPLQPHYLQASGQERLCR